MSDLPDGWELISLGTLIELNPKTNNVEDHIEVGFVPMTLLGKSWLDVPSFELRQWASVKKGYTHFQDGDVLLAKITPCFENGKAGLLKGLPNGIGSGSTEYFVCRTSPHTLDARYLLGYLKTDDFVRTGAMSMTGSVGHKRVPKEYLLGRQIPLPPRNEQTRIANQLDTLLTRVHACNDRFDAIPALLKRFRQTVLRAATSGLLTAATRAERGWSESWETISLGELGELGRGKSKHRPRNDPRLYGGEYPFIQTGDVAQSDGLITEHRQAYSEFGLQQSKLWPAGTICITIAANIADTAILHYPACFPDSVVGFVADKKKCINAFVKWWIDVIKDDLEAFAPATAQKNINLAVLNDVMVRCPSLDEQTEIVRRVEALFALADRIEARCTAARAQAQRLTELVLAKAFRGELVPQDPNDEPASALLARIGSSNTVVAEKSKQKVPVARKKRA